MLPPNYGRRRPCFLIIMPRILCCTGIIRTSMYLYIISFFFFFFFLYFGYPRVWPLRRACLGFACAAVRLRSFFRFRCGGARAPRYATGARHARYATRRIRATGRGGGGSTGRACNPHDEERRAAGKTRTRTPRRTREETTKKTNPTVGPGGRKHPTAFARVRDA